MLAVGRNDFAGKIDKVMLVAPPGKITVTEHGSRERKLAVPPLGLAYLTGKLIAHGIEVEILDVLIEGYDNEQQVDSSAIVYGLDEASVRQRIRDSGAQFIGVSCLFSNRGQEAMQLCRWAKEENPDAVVVLGGQHPSGMPQMVLDPAVDCILYGEADHAIIELIDALNAGKPVDDVSQIILKKPDGFWKSPKTTLPQVEDLPYPAWDHFQLDKYWHAGINAYEITETRESRFMVMISSRGCPHDCYFCTAPMMTDRRYRPRELDDVVAEIKAYREKYEIDEVNFWDDNFFINKKRVKELLARMIAEFPGLRFQVPSGSEINCLDEEVIDLMAKAGFTKVFMAVESPNEEIQAEHIDKRVKLDRIPKLVEKLRDVGIISEGSFMVGFPHETKEQVDRTFDRVTQFGFDRISISIVNPLPGTELYEKVEAENLLQDGFDPQDVRWSAENIKLDGVERGYLGKRRREVWKDYMQTRIDVEKYEAQNVKSLKAKK